ncbi:MAG: DUF423 domain-containing protein [Thiohalocapsa sp.]|jgi:uncharacterized membrane protein YgdD (TMEM256/DUF423 family)|uniref:DUF423 domain-containing protein n=1 Tax=Thiohalocapsa sp. TaxID=2497641 RepID=UPI0025D497B3|nr:DUF423 domain-containing protein [Thiohalocapsa sp.]MCG6940905.1 DUF423 domain-containing protein [Thiohalocapsa sp.]
MTRPSSLLIAVAALFGFAAVLLGAFGAHGLTERVSPERLAIWQTAAHYLGWHATTLLAIALLDAHFRGVWLRVAAWAMVVGSILFSGSLFVLVLTDTPAWGAVTPFGGVALALGWASLAFAASLKLGVARDGDAG